MMKRWVRVLMRQAPETYPDTKQGRALVTDVFTRRYGAAGYTDSFEVYSGGVKVTFASEEDKNKFMWPVNLAPSRMSYLYKKEA